MDPHAELDHLHNFCPNQVGNGLPNRINAILGKTPNFQAEAQVHRCSTQQVGGSGERKKYTRGALETHTSLVTKFYCHD